MADCGASGTALDRATRAILSNVGTTQNGAGGKHIENLLGHATMVGLSQNQMLPATAPTHMNIPLPHGEEILAGPPMHQHQHNGPVPIPMTRPMIAPNQAHVMQNYHHNVSQEMQSNYGYHGYESQAAQAQMVMQQQQQMNAMIQQQQQQYFQMQQQYQQQMATGKQKIKGGSKNEKAQMDSTKNINSTKQKGLESWHDGLDEDLPQELREQIEREYDEILSGGASMEQLSEAWAQAEAEYSAELDSGEYDPTNMWSGEEQNENVAAPYEFVNQEAPKEFFDWMDEGMKHLREGNIRQAIYSFEMELQHGNPDNSTAWRMLGQCHAENDQDDLAIRCLEAAVDRDPYSPESLLALGVSYVNELQHEKALENLKAWITNNPKYAGIELPEDIYSSAPTGASADSTFDEVKKLLLAALDFDPSDAGDVYEALGVICNVNKDYDSAVESFQKAIDLRQGRDYQLFNKLGATLANSGKSEEALPLYHKALQIKPKYARAFLNMAIAHSNLKNHDDASRCYLQALSLNPSATHCWTYLRMSLSCAERWDLLSFVFSQNLAAFQDHFDFVLYEN